MSERIEGHASVTEQTASMGSAVPSARRTSSIAVLVAAASVFGMSYSLAGPLIAFDLERRGFGSLMIGANAAMHALGVLAIAPLLPWCSQRLGRRAMLLAAFTVTVVLFALFPLLHAVTWWFILRFGLGVAAEVIFVITESWTSELSPTTARGRIMAVYTGVLSIGFVAGPAALSLLPQAGPIPFGVGVLAAILAGLVVMFFPPSEAGQETSAGLPMRQIVLLSPLAMGTTLLNAGVETAGLSFLPLYAGSLGWSEAAGTRLIAVLMLGAIVLQLPVGWLADRFDRRRLMVILGSGCTAGAFAWPFVLPVPMIAYPALFLWGGAFVGLYTTMLADIGERFSGPMLIGIYGAMGLFWGLGALIGPLAVGMATDISRHGLPLLIGTACAIYSVLMVGFARTKSRLSQTGLQS